MLDPFSGASTTGIAAVKNGRSYIGVELNPEYVEISRKRFEREFGVELNARNAKATEHLHAARTVEASCHCAIAVDAEKVNSERERRYEQFRERMLALAATELAA